MSAERRPAARLADFLPYQLSVAANAVSGRISSAYRDRFGLRVTEWRVMAVLGDHGAATQRELVSLTLMDKVAVNRACKVLEDRALVSRAPNARDGRSHHLELTSEGRTMRERIMPLALEMERQLFEFFSEEERATFREFLERARSRAGEIGPGDEVPGTR